MEVLIRLLVAAEAAYEMNPTPNLEKWIDFLEEKINQKIKRESNASGKKMGFL